MSKNTRNRILLTALAALLLVTLTIGGTVAWLTASSSQVVNEFKGSNVSVSLDESTGDEYQFIPGVEIQKDPDVTAEADVPCYVFVEITKTNWPDKVELNIDPAWTHLSGGVYYIEGTPAEETGKYTMTDQAVISGDKIAVKSDLTKEDIAGFFKDADGKALEVKLTFKAYIIQKVGLTDQNSDGVVNAADAWQLVSTAETK